MGPGRLTGMNVKPPPTNGEPLYMLQWGPVD